MLTNAIPPFVFVMRTRTAKTLWDRIVVLAKKVFLEMNILAKVEEVLYYIFTPQMLNYKSNLVFRQASFDISRSIYHPSHS